MRLVQIADGFVVNASIGTPGQDIPNGWLASDEAQIGWAVVGGVPVAPETPVYVSPVPATVSRFQARAALLQAGLLDDVNAFIANADELTQLAWAEAVEFPRNSPMMNGLAVQFDLTQAQLDDLFRQASLITV